MNRANIAPLRKTFQAQKADGQKLKLSVLNRPGAMRNDPIYMGNNAKKLTIGPVSQALKDKAAKADWSKSGNSLGQAKNRHEATQKLKNSVPNVKPGVKHSKSKVGKAKEAPF